MVNRQTFAKETVAVWRFGLIRTINANYSPYDTARIAARPQFFLSASV